MTPTGERVRQAALELFAERGFHGTGIRQLAERAGVSSASLYHYLGTKEDLLVALGLLDHEPLGGLAEKCSHRIERHVGAAHDIDDGGRVRIVVRHIDHQAGDDARFTPPDGRGLFAAQDQGKQSSHDAKGLHSVVHAIPDRASPLTHIG